MQELNETPEQNCVGLTVQREARCTNDLLNVGDTLITQTFLGFSRYVISRVTKTLAFSKRERDGYEHVFKRKISFSMEHPRQQWCTTRYSVERKAI